MLETERSRASDDVGDVLDTVKAYAKQETIDPLKGGAKAAALGVAGSVFLGVGLIIVAIIYWVEPAKSLPFPDFLGHQAGSNAVHIKHGIAASESVIEHFYLKVTSIQHKRESSVGARCL